ncbi:Fe-S biogenesis protein NfuA [Candidatus Erwinia haradaeae]|uniref:Fe/S biogenesis protein NfuA n=1 Tax=Candidatus Erwinia haradaeae TaxID=1922217 RepID=A0A803FTY7_9GAMM|nr:Fe-S biogenesis protein NfuA [Candidatus Erwinia haradaeae]VFP88370.1 Fe/S biogenesis protein NfuA [Candidatus Erwinia haradaeae]
MIIITDTAQVHFSQLLSKKKHGTQIRIFVINPGTLTAECGVSYCPPETISETDTQLTFPKFSAFIDESSLPYLQDAEIDFVTDSLVSQLTLKAPNAKKPKINPESPLIDQIKYFLQTKINPKLANHGGGVSVIKITDEGYVVLKFRGGCNGCSMANFTMKEGIERELITQFPELKGAHDMTDHEHGDHSFY